MADLFVPESFSTTREEPELRRERGPLYAFTMQGLYAVGVASVALGIARAMLDAFIGLAGKKAPRGLARLADSAVVQADVARAEARLGAARAYLLETLATIYAHADDVDPIGIDDRARVRLACTNAIHRAIEVADFSYKAAGVDGISQAARSSVASAISTRCHSKSRHAAPTSRPSARSCSACCPRYSCRRVSAPRHAVSTPPARTRASPRVSTPRMDAR